MHDSEIAIIGLACRFPGARNPGEFWKNLESGVESISFFSEEELLSAGVRREILSDPKYVRAAAVVEGIEEFDAEFFGFTPRETELLDPQHRLFMECAWEALESAGYPEPRPNCLVGVFAGAGLNTYVLNNIYPNRELVESAGGFQVMLANDKDFLATRVSYKFGLRGPSVTVQTACSTSLVAVHLACQSLLNGECDLSLAGGVSIGVPQKVGYLHREGMIRSGDGHCRPFDARADGTVAGSGAGIVVLKRLEDAIRDRDTIQAVIKGSAINNDGGQKVGYTAPSPDGQQAVLSEALAVAGVEPETISYIEAHGTGTLLGDPIEVSALVRAFPQRQSPCAIGSVKSNIGHLDTAAGIAGLIKTVLALTKGTIPPSLHFQRLNPQIDFLNRPFFINTKASEWKTSGFPRRAGVSSFGIGGTNAHVVLEESPEPASGRARPYHLLPVSGQTEAALAEGASNLASHLADLPGINLADVAYTLCLGRRAFANRRIAVCSSPEEGAKALTSWRSAIARPVEAEPKVVFMFPGQGSQYTNMGLELYCHEPVFREQVDKCAELLVSHINEDLRLVLYPRDSLADAEDRLARTALAQPALFTVGYALSQLWMHWGIKPSSMIGHSVGEYVAACLSGVFTLEDALSLVALRGRLIQALPPGKMLGVHLSEIEAFKMLSSDLSIAAVNGPGSTVLSGPELAIETLREELLARRINCKILKTSRAFHSWMMEPIIREFTEAVHTIGPREPRIPYLSNVSGGWITKEQTMDPGYWSGHLRNPVRFSDGLDKVFGQGPVALLEMGPGRTLTNLARRHPSRTAADTISASLGNDGEPALRSALSALGHLWQAGVKVDWEGFYRHEHRSRIPLPTYPFQRKRYWIDQVPILGQMSKLTRQPADAWFYLPHWQPTAWPQARAELDARRPLWVVFADECSLVQELLGESAEETLLVRSALRFLQGGENEFAIEKDDPEDYVRQLERLPVNRPLRILHLWNACSPSDISSSFYSLVYLAQAVGRLGLGQTIELIVVSSGMQSVAGERIAHPIKATLLGPVKVIPKEYPNVRVCSVDFQPGSLDWRTLGRRLHREFAAGLRDPVVAYRGAGRFIPGYAQATLENQPKVSIPIRPHGTYLITGGLGGIGLALAEHLSKQAPLNLILTSRSAPARAGRTNGEKQPSESDLGRIEAILRLEACGATVRTVSADVSDADRMKELWRGIGEEFGELHGVIHAAGIPGGGVMQRKRRESLEAVLAPKVDGSLVLLDCLREYSPDFIVICSSISSMIGEFGQCDYCAANAFLDALTYSDTGHRIVCINWDTWKETGMAVRTPVSPDLQEARRAEIQLGLSTEEGKIVFDRILQADLKQVIVSTVPFGPRVIAASSPQRSPLNYRAASAVHGRPRLTSPHTEPTNGVERELADIWQELLGIQQIGTQDDFFELGGDSLLATQVISRVREQLRVDVPLAQFFVVPTVASLAATIERISWFQRPLTQQEHRTEEIIEI
jgi:acyl transferase domain-containing protein/acyl carrier protein